MIYSSDKVFEIFKVNIAEEAKQIAKNAINRVEALSRLIVFLELLMDNQN